MPYSDLLGDETPSHYMMMAISRNRNRKFYYLNERNRYTIICPRMMTREGPKRVTYIFNKNGKLNSKILPNNVVVRSWKYQNRKRLCYAQDEILRDIYQSTKEWFEKTMEADRDGVANGAEERSEDGYTRMQAVLSTWVWNGLVEESVLDVVEQQDLSSAPIVRTVERPSQLVRDRDFKI